MDFVWRHSTTALSLPKELILIEVAWEVHTYILGTYNSYYKLFHRLAIEVLPMRKRQRTIIPIISY